MSYFDQPVRGTLNGREVSFRVSSGEVRHDHRSGDDRAGHWVSLFGIRYDEDGRKITTGDFPMDADTAEELAEALLNAASAARRSVRFLLARINREDEENARV